MNKIAESLYVIGGLCIVGGIVLGVANYEVVIYQENGIYGTESVTEASWVNLLIYVLAGLVAGVIMFGFGEVIRILDDKRKIATESYKEILSIKQHIVGSEENHNVHRTQDNSLEDKTETFDDIQYPSSYSNQDTDNSDTKKGLSGLIDEAVNGKK